MHIALLFNGIFPLFGALRFGFEGIVLIDLSVIYLVCLLWGLLRLRIWAWWGSVVYCGLMAFSSIVALSRASFSDILQGVNFPSTEMEILRGLPFQGFHFAALIGIPLLVALGLIAFSKRYFGNVESVA